MLEARLLPDPASLKNPATGQGQALPLIIAAGSRRTDDAQKSMVWVWHEWGVSGYRRSSFIALRTLRIAAGGVVAEVEACRIVSEKIETG
jgi:hypothetical protein